MCSRGATSVAPSGVWLCPARSPTRFLAASNFLSVTPSDWAAFPTIAESKSEPTCFSLKTAVFFSSLSLRTHLPLSASGNP